MARLVVTKLPLRSVEGEFGHEPDKRVLPISRGGSSDLVDTSALFRLLSSNSERADRGQLDPLAESTDLRP